MSSDLPVVIYSPESPLGNPRKLVADIFSDLWRCRELIWILFQRDLKAQFRQSFLGYVWLFLPPVMTTVVWLFLNGQNVIQISDTGMPYPIFVIVGTILWQTFARALQSPLQSFNAGKPVFMKLKVPPEAFIAAGTARAIFDFLIYALAALPVFLFYQVIPPWTILLTPIAVLALLALGTALGLLALPLGGLYGDVQQAIAVMLGFLMYLAPVVYPTPTTGIAARIVGWNPITPILNATRDWLTIGGVHHLPVILLILALSLFVSFIALIAIRVVMPHLVARMGM